LANVDRFSKSFHQVIRKKIHYVHITDFYLNCSVFLHYLVKVKSPKMLQNFHVEFKN